MTNHDFEKALAALKALTHNDDETPMMIDMACWLIDHLDEVTAALQAAIAKPVQWMPLPAAPDVGGGGLMNTFYTDQRPEGKFIALFADGSGAGLFCAVDGEDGIPAYVDHEGDFIPDAETYFIDAGYSHWIPIPDNFQLWFERTP